MEHHRAFKRQAKDKAHDAYIVRTYRGMGPGDYQRIWEHQGGRCAICKRTLHTTKRGALEHDHALNWPFGITCAPCNDFLGYIGRRLDVAQALVVYLQHPPAWEVIGPPPEQRDEKPF